MSVGLLLALFSFERISDPEPRAQRAEEEAVVLAAREILQSYVSPGEKLLLVDPLDTNRKVGKVYIYPTEAGWEVSGHYRRDTNDTWHPYLMSLDNAVKLINLAVRDSNERLLGLSSQDSKFSAVP